MKQNLDQLISHWQSKKIITSKQAEQMRSDIALDSKERSKNRFIMALSTLGAIALGAGVLLFVSSNWSALPDAVKLLMAMLMPIVPIGLAYYMLEIKKTYISLGRGALFVGIAMIGAALAIIGQVYHLESEYFRFLLVWAALAAPFVYWFKRSESCVLLAIILGGALFAGLAKMVERNWLFDDVFAAMLPVVFTLYGAGLYGLGRFWTENNAWKRVATVFRVLGVKLVLLTLFVMTFEFYGELVEDAFNIPEDLVRLFFNVFYVAFLVYVLMRAIKLEADKVVSAVFFWFGVFILFRYFDFFWDMLPTSLFFMVGGALFIGGAMFLEKKRKTLLATFDKDSVVKNLIYDD